MEQNLILKTVRIPNIKSYEFVNFYSNIIIVASSDKIERYISVPKDINIKKINNSFLLSSISVKNLEIFSKLLELWLKSLTRPSRKKLILKGLGYKANINNKSLELKLGFSHSLIIPIPSKDINVKTNKNLITFESYNREMVGNFTSKIRHLKKPDAYKGKGIWYQNENKLLKEVKKK